MPPSPGSPVDWLRFARSDLAVASRPPEEGVLLETLCFHAQQAAEKCLKAVLVARGRPVPRTHNLGTLAGLLPQPVGLPAELEDVLTLTVYAVEARYPGMLEEVTPEDHAEAVRLAEVTLAWAEAACARENTP